MSKEVKNHHPLLEDFKEVLWGYLSLLGSPLGVPVVILTLLVLGAIGACINGIYQFFAG